jgi:integrase
MATTKNRRRLGVSGRPGHNAGQTFDLDIPSPDQVQAISDAFNRGATGDRNRALVAVMYRAGLRISEAVGSPARPKTATTSARTAKPGLRMKDYDPAERTIRIHAANAKGGRPRTTCLDPEGAAILDRWIDRRRRLGLTGRAPLFCQLDGRPWSAQAAREALRYAARKAGLDLRANPHSFRHAHAVRLDESGARVSLIQRQLGHANLAVTTTYLAGIAADRDMAAAIDSATF